MLLTVALLVGAAGTATTSGATPSNGGSPALSVDPPVDLVDGQDVTVHGTGFVPGSRAVVHQCENAPVGPVDCELGAASTAAVEADGTFSVRQRVFATIVPPRQDGATDCKSNVVCDALILDAKSRSDTYPYIEIAEQDVSVGHEASVSRIGEEQLFYLMSRGLSEDEASAMIVNGFIEPLVKELPMEYAVEMNRLIQLQMEGSVG